MARLVHIIVWALLLVANAGAYASWTVRYQHTDTLGSVIAESNTQGTITQRFDYKPFGEGTPTQKSGLGYTGHLEDTDLGLTYMQQRYYDPVIGRFYSNDPVGFTASNPMMFNRYAYANNNPYKFNDPDGKEPLPNVFAQAFGYNTGYEANRQGPSDLKAGAAQWASDVKNDTRVGLQVVSDVAGSAGIAVLSAGPEAAPIAGALLAVGEGAGLASAALSDSPVKNIGIEIATNTGPGKFFKAAAETIKGAVKIEKNSPDATAFDVGAEVSAKMHGDSIKENINKK